MFGSSYFHGALDGFRREVSRLKDAVGDFGDGRVYQWESLLKERDQLERDLAVEQEENKQLAKQIAGPTQWRPFVVAMANAMEEKLRANDHKNNSGWNDLSNVLSKLMEEVAELAHEASAYGAGEGLLKEAADVANLAGMVVCYLDHTMPNYSNKVNHGQP